MEQNASSIMPRRGHQPDKYDGQLHATSKLRHGTGRYNYDNTFFVYEGQYEQGKKNGQGKLICKDGTIINGTFKNNELVGPAVVEYPSQARYEGELLFGERSGKGKYSSEFESYEGEWLDNKKHGKGIHKNLSVGQEYSGDFVQDKYEGQGSLKGWNYRYEGHFRRGVKEGQGKEISDWLREQDGENGKFEYNGQYSNDKFEGEGEFKSRESKYVYSGKFNKGKPELFLNEFKVLIGKSVREGEEIKEGDKAPLPAAIEYELEGDIFSLYIESVYQGPEQLDEIQPTQEEIENMIKNWQNENKKNKNPPPMPDFNQPRMKKPEVVVVDKESGREIQLRLLKEVEGKDEVLKIDYRAEIVVKRKQNQEAKEEANRKAEEDAGKKGGKKDNKGEAELKVNLFKEKPTQKEQILSVLNTEGRASITQIEFPDDFPPGKYFLEISSSTTDFDKVPVVKTEINIKAKVAKKK